MINNEFYDLLDEKWLTATDHPVALLRAENRLRIPWIIKAVAKRFSGSISFIDIGCGAGLLANALAIKGHQVTAIDLSHKSLNIARKYDVTKSVNYLHANGYLLPFADAAFDAACALDVLEHVEEPERLIAEAARVLKPGGLFFFHTFNRTPISYLFVIKGVEWCVRNTPPNMHVYPLFITPKELKTLCNAHGLSILEMIGVNPKFFSIPFLKMLLTRKIDPSFSFQFTKSLATGYCGIALKKGA
ncbi:MAG TPA: bifunctional 2-polyprenyl-6-hydroxyphenol methylase/3-demethylubiquinol 3-O-methyltransferase UbiG [Chlamydiales bacterium]|nr:bifunctional 2-polyprenyl-6-hydroxyphenol methylase/3-demethylubiquinol 3-O-methyltransferase UbiG [Chlamydiales bacterium]